jgi:D-aminopeptidase
MRQRAQSRFSLIGSAGLPSRKSARKLAEEIPTVTRVNEHTVRFQATDYLQGYRLFRILYKYLQVN